MASSLYLFIGSRLYLRVPENKHESFKIHLKRKKKKLINLLVILSSIYLLKYKEELQQYSLHRL